jgi:hypothetical protein
MRMMMVFRPLLAVLGAVLAACGLTPQPQDLSLAGISPGSSTVAQGQMVTLTLTLTSQNGFQGQVTLSVLEGGQPVPWLSPSSVQRNLSVPRGGQVQETLQVQVAPNAPTGSRSLVVRAAYGNQLAELAFILTVIPPPDFTLSLNPSSLTLQQGSSGTTQLTITPQGGFTGTVSLSLLNAPPGVTLSPTSVNVPGPNLVTQTLTLSVASGVPTGSYGLQLIAISGSFVKTANLSLTVTPGPDFTLSLNPSSLTLQQGSSGTTQLTITPQGGFTGTVFLSLAGAPPGVTLSPTSVNVPGPGPVTYVLTLSVAGSVPAGSYNLQLTAISGTLTRTANLTLTVTPAPDFAIFLNPTSLSIPRGSSGNTLLTIVPQGGFTGTVSISLVNPPPGVSLPPTSVNVTVPLSLSLTINVANNASPDTYNLRVRAQSGSIVREAILVLTVTP